MNENLAMILSALAAGAAKPAGQVAQDLYSGLKVLIRGRFERANKGDEGRLLEKYEKKPDVTEPLLQSELAEVGVDQDEAILAKARELLAAIAPEPQTPSPQMVINAKKVQGVIQNNTGTVHQTFH